MPRPWVLPALLLALVAAPAPPCARAADPVPVWDGSSRADEVKKAIREAFGATPERRAELRTLFESLGTMDAPVSKRWTKVVADELERQGPRFPSKSGEPFAFGGLTGPVHFAGKGKRGGWMLLALHGGGEGNGDGREALQKWSFVQSKALVVAPTAPELRASAWCQEDIERWTLALVEAACRTFDLDPDRIYLAGHSMGGYGTWSVGCRHADRFAALGACAGGIFVMGGAPGAGVTLAPGHVPNLLSTPIWFYNSTDDRQVRPDSSQAANRMLEGLKEQGYPYTWVYEEFHDIGHGLPPKGLKPIADWMLEHKRNPAPKRVVFEPSRAGKRRLFWLGTTGSGRVEGRLEGNAITLTAGAGAGAITLWLSERLIDPTMPVTVTRNGERVFDGPVPARLSTVVEGLLDARDPGLAADRAITLP